MNKVIIKGRLTKDPEVKYRTSGSDALCYARFCVAVEDRTWKEEEKFHVDFISCQAAGKVAEVIEKTLSKGKEVLLSGKWRTGSYTNQEGKKVYTNALFVQELYFCGKKEDNQSFMNMPDDDFGGLDGEMPFK